jgi:hypothetical protein
MTEAELRHAARALAPGDHPSEEQWERFATAELPDAERTALLDHALVCGTCARTLAALQELERLAPGALGAGAVPRHSVSSAGARWDRPIPRWSLALAAALVAAIAIGLFGVRRAAEAPRFRGSGQAEALPRLVGIEPAEDGAALALRFDRGPARLHQVVVFDAGGAEIWRSTPTSEPFVLLPVVTLPRPGTYLWQVRAVGEPSEPETAAPRSSIGRFEWHP